MIRPSKKTFAANRNECMYFAPASLSLVNRLVDARSKEYAGGKLTSGWPLGIAGA
jgi:hypothetical protein